MDQQEYEKKCKEYEAEYQATEFSEDGFMKRAWIRDPGQPIGQPGTGHINCPCGQTPESVYVPSWGDVKCACGTVYTWDGWIKSRPPQKEKESNG